MHGTRFYGTNSSRTIKCNLVESKRKVRKQGAIDEGTSSNGKSSQENGWMGRRKRNKREMVVKVKLHRLGFCRKMGDVDRSHTSMPKSQAWSGAQVRATLLENAQSCSPRASSLWLSHDNSPRYQEIKHSGARSTKTILNSKHARAHLVLILECFKR